MLKATNHLVDREGNQYPMCVDDDNNGLDIYLFDGNKCIGEARCVLKSSEDMVWGNLILFDNVVFPPEGIWEHISRFVGMKPKVHNYRGRGLGKALAREVLARAQQKGVKRMRGWVRKKDLDTTPWLLTWYERLGFTVRRVNEEAVEGTDTVAHLFLEFAEECQPVATEA